MQQGRGASRRFGSFLVGVVGPLVLGTAGGCVTPYPLVSLRPFSSQVTWVAGRSATSQERGGIRVATAFERQQVDKLEVRVEIENATGGPLDVVPREFSYTTCLATDVKSCRDTRLVIDPDQELVDLDATASRTAADAANSQAVLGTLVLLSAIADVGSLAGGHPNRAGGTDALSAAALLDDARTRADLAGASIETQRAIWSDVALRRNTLLPGRGVAGDVFFPIDPQAGLVWVHVRTAGQVFSFPFHQTVTNLDAQASDPGGPARYNH